MEVEPTPAAALPYPNVKVRGHFRPPPHRTGPPVKHGSFSSPAVVLWESPVCTAHARFRSRPAHEPGLQFGIPAWVQNFGSLRLTPIDRRPANRDHHLGSRVDHWNHTHQSRDSATQLLLFNRGNSATSHRLSSTLPLANLPSSAPALEPFRRCWILKLQNSYCDIRVSILICEPVRYQLSPVLQPSLSTRHNQTHYI